MATAPVRAAAVAAVLAAAGCAGVGVQRIDSLRLPDDCRVATLPCDGPSPRTRQTLRRFDLPDDFHRDRAKTLQRLRDEIDKELDPDVLFALAELHKLEARRAGDAGEWLHAAGFALRYIVAAGPADAYDPRFRLACEIYNESAASVLRACATDGKLPAAGPFTLKAGDTSVSVPAAVRDGVGTAAGFLFADDYRVYGLANHYRTPGLGVPLIGTRPPAGPAEDGVYPAAVAFPATAVLRFDGGLASVEILHADLTETVTVAGRTLPLETDRTTPVGYQLSRVRLQRLAIEGFLDPDKLRDRAGLYLLDPYRPGKIPVVLVHGLFSSPLAWAPLYNDLQSDPRLRDRFQFWAYFYPTGAPFLATAADLRDALAAARRRLDPGGTDAALDDVVLVGHSMGGLLSRVQTVDGGDDFWRAGSGEPFDAARLRPETRSELRRVVFFERQPSVRRVVFIATPHRGSRLSPSLPGRLASHLVKLPRRLRDAAADFVDETPDARAGRLPTSIDLLSPDSAALRLLAGRPRPPGVAYHSIIGSVPKTEAVVERALAWDFSDEPTDGVVPYKSSHLDGADSELVVPAAHGEVYRHPLAIREVRRILLEHARAAGGR